MLKKKVILLVEDDEDLRRSLKEALLDEGTYEVVDKPDGKDALEWLARNPKPSIIISDYLMKTKGSDLARSAERMSLNTIIITGNHDDALVAVRAYNLKIPIIKKPFDIFKLIEMIDKYTASELEHKGVQVSA